MENQLNGHASPGCKAEEFSDDTFDTLALDLLKHIETSQSQRTSCNNSTNNATSTPADKHPISAVDVSQIWTREKRKASDNTNTCKLVDDCLAQQCVNAGGRPTANKPPVLEHSTSVLD